MKMAKNDKNVLFQPPKTGFQWLNPVDEKGKPPKKHGFDRQNIKLGLVNI